MHPVSIESERSPSSMYMKQFENLTKIFQLTRNWVSSIKCDYRTHSKPIERLELDQVLLPKVRLARPGRSSL